MYLEEYKRKRNLIMHWNISSRGIPSIVEKYFYFRKKNSLAMSIWYSYDRPLPIPQMVIYR